MRWCAVGRLRVMVPRELFRYLLGSRYQAAAFGVWCWLVYLEQNALSRIFHTDFTATNDTLAVEWCAPSGNMLLSCLTTPIYGLRRELDVYGGQSCPPPFGPAMSLTQALGYGATPMHSVICRGLKTTLNSEPSGMPAGA
jgi:hypothetical protein